MDIKTQRPIKPRKIRKKAQFNREILTEILGFIERSELNPKLDKLIKNASYGDWYWQLPEDVQKACLEATGDIREIRFMLIRALGYKPCMEDS